MAHIFNANMECNSLDEFQAKVETNGTVTVSNVQAKTKIYSVRSGIIAGGVGYVYISNSECAHSELYYRIYYYLPTATYDTCDTEGDYVYFLYTTDMDATMVFGVYVIYFGGVVTLRFKAASLASDFTTCPTRDAWHCIEVYNKRDAVNGAWEWWVDGVSINSASSVNTGPKNIQISRFGISVSNGVAGAVYIDNIVIATSRIYELMGNIPQGNTLRNRKETPQGWII